MIENRMVVDSEWKTREPEILGYCEFCGQEVYEGDAFEYDNGILLHGDCIMDYLKENDLIMEVTA